MSEVPLLKVVIVGDAAVGKTTLVRRYCEGKFQESRVATIGVDFYTQLVRLPSETVKLSIWDMAGQQRFQAVRTGFYRGSRAAALVFDVTDPATLVHLRRWQQEVLRTAPGQRLLVVGNKTDLPRSVRYAVGRVFASYVGATYLETSAKSGKGVSQLFGALAQLAVRS